MSKEIENELASSEDAGGMLDVSDVLGHKQEQATAPVEEEDLPQVEETSSTSDQEWQSCNSLRWKLQCTQSDLFFASRNGNRISGKTIKMRKVKNKEGDKITQFCAVGDE